MNKEPIWKVSVIGAPNAQWSPDGQFVSLIFPTTEGDVLLDFHWESLGPLLEIVKNVAGKLAALRDPSAARPFPKQATFISGFAVGISGDGQDLVLSLESPGLRFDYAIPRHLKGEDGTPLVETLAKALSNPGAKPPPVN